MILVRHVTCDIIIISYYYNPSMSRGYTIKVVCMGNIIAYSIYVSHFFPATFEFGSFFLFLSFGMMHQ